MNSYHTVVNECNYESVENGINIILDGKVADSLPFKVSEYGESRILDICKRWLHRKGYILKDESIFLNELEDLCFDVLGDHANPNDIYVEISPQFEWRVIITRLFSPREFVGDDWKNATKGTKFENVKLFC